MKRIFALVFTIFFCLCCFVSCGSEYKENTWFSDEKLSECFVSELPVIEKDYVKHNDENIYVYFSTQEREAYICEIYEYLKLQNFQYLGTRGGQASTLAGTFTTYYFAPASELSDFYVDGAYRFVYSDGTLDESSEPIFCILYIYENEAKDLEYGTKNFSYNTFLALRYETEAPLSGRYVLKEGESQHSCVE